MAAKQKGSFSEFKKKSRKKRPGIHSKSKSSKLKNSRKYNKRYVGQGR